MIWMINTVYVRIVSDFEVVTKFSEVIIGSHDKTTKCYYSDPKDFERSNLMHIEKNQS